MALRQELYLKPYHEVCSCMGRAVAERPPLEIVLSFVRIGGFPSRGSYPGWRAGGVSSSA